MLTPIPSLMQRAASRAQEQHERRLARIVADQWMHVSRKRLEAAWCAQMVNCWRDVCTESRWVRSQTYFADKHHTYQKFMKAFNALREGSRTKWKNQLAAAKFHKEVLEKKTLRGLFKAQQSRKQQHKQLYLAKAFKAVKHYHEKKKLLRCMYNGAQIFHGTSLKRHALNCLSNHHQRVKLESSREATASCHWKKFTRSNVLKRWGTIACRIAKAKKQIDESRTVFLKGLQKRCMENWYLVTNERKRAIQSKFVQAYQEVKKSRQKRTLKVWSQWHREKQLRRLKSEQIATMHSGRTSAAVTKAWQDYAREKGKGRAKSSIAFSFRRKQVLLDAIAVWKAYQAKKERAGAAALKALVHLKQNLAQKSMDSWKPWHEKQMSKKKGREEALNIYKYRLQRWACERILAVGLMLQALRLQSRMRKQSMSFASAYMKVAPYARKWWYLSQRRSNLRRAILHPKEAGSPKVIQKKEIPLASSEQPVMQEILLRIGIERDGLKIQHERPAPLLVDMNNTHERPQPRGRMLLSPPSSIPAEVPLVPASPAVKERPAARRPAFLTVHIPSS